MRRSADATANLHKHMSCTLFCAQEEVTVHVCIYWLERQFYPLLTNSIKLHANWYNYCVLVAGEIFVNATQIAS